MLGELLLGVLSSVFFEGGKIGLKRFFTQSPAKKAIAATAAEFSNVPGVGDALTKWCQSNDFVNKFEALHAGKQSDIDEALIRSFIDVTLFYDGLNNTTRSAKRILETFAKYVEQELYRSEEGLFIEATRAKNRHQELTNNLHKLDQKMDQLPDQITIAFNNTPSLDTKSQVKPFIIPPLPPQTVIGRKKVLSDVARLLALRSNVATNVPPVALWGMGGIGKTTIATALARRMDIREIFPDGVVWTAVGPRPNIRNLLTNLGTAFGVDLRPEPDEAACVERLRDALHERRALIIVDDIWEIAHGEYFKLAGPHCRTLVTTRESPIAYALTTQDHAKRVDVLTSAASLTLLRKLAPKAVSADKETAQRLCQKLEFLPLALKLAGQLLANEAGVPSHMRRIMDELIERREARLQLPQAEGRPGLKENEPVSLQAILGMSVERLNPTDQERFARLAIFGSEPLNWKIEEAAFVCECRQEDAEATISRLIQRGLIDRRGEYYWMHALLADYAQEMLEAMNL